MQSAFNLRRAAARIFDGERLTRHALARIARILQRRPAQLQTETDVLCITSNESGMHARTHARFRVHRVCMCLMLACTATQTDAMSSGVHRSCASDRLSIALPADATLVEPLLLVIVLTLSSIGLLQTARGNARSTLACACCGRYMRHLGSCTLADVTSIHHTHSLCSRERVQVRACVRSSIKA